VRASIACRPPHGTCRAPRPRRETRAEDGVPCGWHIFSVSDDPVVTPGTDSLAMIIFGTDEWHISGFSRMNMPFICFGDRGLDPMNNFGHN
jgi:hypothetical protein